MTNIARRLTFNAALFLILALCGGATRAQEMKERELKPAYDFSKIQMPVEFVNIKLNGASFEPGQKIQAGDDWLQGVSFTLKNVSDKPIAYVEVGLQFRHAADPRDYTVYILNYGLDQAHGRVDSAPQAAPRPIQPGETVELVLSKDKYPGFQKILSGSGVSGSVETAAYFADKIFFEGDPDTMWRGGKLLRRDANDLYKFNVIERYSLPSRQAAQD